MSGILLRAVGNIQRGTIHTSYSQRGFIQKKIVLIEDNYVRVESEKFHRRDNIKCYEDSEKGELSKFQKEKYIPVQQPIFRLACTKWWLFFFLDRKNTRPSNRGLGSTTSWHRDLGQSPQWPSLKNNTGTDLQEVNSVAENRGK